MKSLVKKISLKSIMLTVIVTIFMAQSVFASDLQLTEADKSQIYAADSAINEKGSPILTIALYIIYAAAVILVIYKGLQFMNRASNPEDRASAKKELIAVAIGAFLIFTIGEILKIIASIAWTSIG